MRVLPNMNVISIHTPTRGATNFPAPRIKSQYISIHTPTRGATSGCLIIKARYPYFNPHSHEGSDCRLCFFTCRQDNFNPHSHEGSDLFCLRNNSYIVEFQSTLPRGERQCHIIAKMPMHLFQSTLPRGERRLLLKIISLTSRFQSTLPRGERRK